MLATPGPQPIGEDWQHEVKWDGMRVLADVSATGLRLFSRTGRDVTVSFPELDSVLAGVKDALIDGEIIALREGTPSFAALAERMHVADERRARELAQTQPVTVMAFDLLRLYGVDLAQRPLAERRTSLDRLSLPEQTWRRSPIYADGPALLAATLDQGLEGVVAKRRRSTYQPGRRSPDWVKTAHRLHQVCLVGGWRPEAGSAEQIGALLLGVPDGAGGLSFAGRVGSGISRSTGQDLTRLLGPLRLAQSPFSTEVPRLDAAGATWCEPALVVEVRHLGWTPGDRLRQPVFRGVRTDLTPAEVRRES
ncbi:MAG TPA: non-homologous end-joining DNA ligase [Jatrophihabitans sp.]|jgi:bifunctional non-homologous end joining protein LigD|uniref:non-homologous end-joining DNA ligase n=1 Tax=Jatrophihabitans sp. TaxID=1932789 RepID=UPI002F195B05